MFMIQEDICDTSLALGLRHGDRFPDASTDHDHHRQETGSTLSNPAPVEPSLTLSEGRPVRLSSPNSTVSSFSAAYPSFKREKEMTVEDDEGSTRKKLRLTKEQSALLEDRFKEHSTLNPKQKQALAKQLNLRPRQVEVWFQNRRARTKLKKTEVDCEFLKRCCEALKDENRRLKRELQELRAIKFTPRPPPPLYMQLPAATLTMCPSCERIGGAGEGYMGRHAGPFMVATKPQFFNPFTHPAAC